MVNIKADSFQYMKETMLENNDETAKKKKIEKKRHLVVVKGRFKRRFHRAFPSYTVGNHIVKGQEVSEEEEHQPLAENKGINEDKKNPSTKIQLVKKHTHQKDFIDPSTYPLEQIHDAEYGIPIDHSSMDRVHLNRKKNRKYILMIFLGSVIIIIASIVASTTSHKHSGNLVDPSKTDPEPEALENVCNITNISTQAGLKKCENACVSLLPSVSIPKPCEVLQQDKIKDIGHSSLSRAPNELGKLCSDASIATQSGFAQCQSACLAGQCCFGFNSFESQLATTTNNPSIMKPCSAQNPYICASYTPCLSIQGMNSPTDLVNQNCAINNIKYPEGKQDCILFCEPRNCCFTKSQSKSCYESNKSWCDEYKSCQNLGGISLQNSVDLDSHITKPSDLVNEICTFRNIRYITGREDCEEVCKQRSCCFSKTGNCLANKKAWCNEFKACSILSEEFSTNECYNISTISPVHAEFCKASCKFGICCFFPNQERCSHLRIDCAQYQHCNQTGLLEQSKISVKPAVNKTNKIPSDSENLLVIEGPIGGEDGLRSGPAVSQVNAACLYSVESSRCYKLCHAFLCCFLDTYNSLSCHTSEICAKYSACSRLKEGYSDELGTNTTGSLSSSPTKSAKLNAIPPTEESPRSDDGTYPADSICSIDNLSMKGGLSLCHALCKKHMCCFGGDGGCPYRNDCPIYQACGILADNRIIQGFDGKLNFNFDNICSLDFLATIGGYDACKKICEPYTCCNTGDCRNALVQNSCDSIVACQNLNKVKVYSNSNTIGEFDNIVPPVDLKAFCSKEKVTSQDPFSITKCLDICKVAECCKKETCLEKLNLCDTYVSCHTVWEVDELNKRKIDYLPGND